MNRPDDWLESVAEMLNVPYGSRLPYTLGEAAEECARWAASSSSEAWEKSWPSLRADVMAAYRAVGPRLRRTLPRNVRTLRTEQDLNAIEDICARVAELWRSTEWMEAAFKDLWELASKPQTTSAMLHPRAQIVISQSDAARSRSWSALNDASSVLLDKPRWYGGEGPRRSLASRIARASDALVTPAPVGRVVVWLVYQRAMVPWREEVGTVTLLDGEGAVSAVRREDEPVFPERDELAMLLQAEAFGPIFDALVTSGERYVLARVDLGERSLTDASADAMRLVDAFLSIAVIRGGLSWQSTGLSVILCDGEHSGGAFTRGVGAAMSSDHSHDVVETAILVRGLAAQFHTPLAQRALPADLADAVQALREAGMVDHREVTMYGARAITPRFATALEDQAMELIASFGGLPAPTLGDAMCAIEVDRRFDQMLSRGLTAGYASTRNAPVWAAIILHGRGGPEFDVLRALDAKDRLRALPMTVLERADFEDAVSVASDATSERRRLAEIATQVKLIRERHRRVRNSISHGNPVSDAALDSIRDYSSSNATTALHYALHAFTTNDSLDHLLEVDGDSRAASRAAMDAGDSFETRLRAAST